MPSLFALPLTWIGLHWLLTRLLLVTAILLRRLYEQGSAIENKDDPVKAPQPPLSDGKPEDNADNGSAHASSGQSGNHDTSGITATESDLDAFERLINSPPGHRGQTNAGNATRQDQCINLFPTPSPDTTKHFHRIRCCNSRYPLTALSDRLWTEAILLRTSMPSADGLDKFNNSHHRATQVGASRTIQRGYLVSPWSGKHHTSYSKRFWHLELALERGRSIAHLGETVDVLEWEILE